MNTRLQELAQRRAMLVARAADQRDELARSADPLRTLSATLSSVMTRGKAVGGFLRQHPLSLAAGIAAVVVLRPLSMLKWLNRGWLAWSIALAVKRRLSDR
jgi:hypothetical protein